MRFISETIPKQSCTYKRARGWHDATNETDSDLFNKGADAGKPISATIAPPQNASSESKTKLRAIEVRR